MTEDEKQRINSKKTLASIAYGFNIVAAVVTAFFLIPMAWSIPMTIRTKFHAYNPTKSHCLALGICSILFLGIFGVVAGILLIIANARTVGLIKK